MPAARPRPIDLNADAGEGFGRWELGDDGALLAHVSSMSVACGFHAGDPRTMRIACELAQHRGVAVGAHPGFPDLLGFGRRALAVSPAETADYCLYQLGALREIARSVDVPLQHLKPHGALYALCSRNLEVAQAIGEAVYVVDPGLILILPAGEIADTVASRVGITVAREAFVDIEYDDEGFVRVEPVYGSVSPEAAAERAAGVLEGWIVTESGRKVPVDADTICIHGDAPHAVEVAEAVSRRLTVENGLVTALRTVIAERPPRRGSLGSDEAHPVGRSNERMTQ
jgi:UPF0271 protein